MNPEEPEVLLDLTISEKRILTHQCLNFIMIAELLNIIVSHQ